MNTPRPLELTDLAGIEVPGQPAISPDGSSIAFVLRGVDAENDTNRSSLYRVGVAGDDPPVRLTHGATDTAPAWSPDGRTIAFLRAADGPAQIWLLPAGGGEPASLTELAAGAGAPVWSPDGGRIAFTAPVDTVKPDTADSSAEPIVIDRLGYKSDGAGFLRGVRQHLFVVDVQSGTTRQLTNGDWHAGRPAWSPDGGRLAFSAATAPDADLTNESVAHVLDLTADEPNWHPVGDRHGLAGPVTWAPDGRALLLVGQREVRVGHNRLLYVPVDEGEVTELTARFDRNVMPGGPGYPGGLPQVAPDGRTVVFCARDRGCTHVYAVDIGGGEPRLLVGGTDRVVSGLSVAAGVPRAAVVMASATSYGEVAMVDLETAAVTTRATYAPHGVELAVPAERVFAMSDGTEVHGWLLRDPAAALPAPLLVDVHGGPHNAWTPVPDPGHAYHQVLAAKGWSVLLLNPRGSDGYGERFFTAAVGGWGLADENDILEPVDQLVGAGEADPARLALTGYSYGGYLTCWLTARTDRFVAAVAGGVVTDLTSMAGTSDAGYALAGLETTALPHESPEHSARQSPLTYVTGVTTPTLILHGQADERCPAGQAEQWFGVLRARGVPARLVLYPGASHLFILDGRPSHRADYSSRVVDWVTRHTPKEHTMPTEPTEPIAASTPTVDRDHWQARLAELADKHAVPGAVLGIALGEESVQVAHGVTNVDTGIEVTTDTLFQIGSITKVWTATVLMRLVDEGKLDLDRPVAAYLPELVLSDPGVTGRVTTRHLLNHTSGIDGDFFHDSGRGDDCIERYLDALAGLPQNHPIGATWSYCNSGFVIAGRLIERLTGQVWDQAMRELLYAPLGLSGTVTLPEEALLHRAAVGHVHEGDEEPRRAPVWGLPRSLGPAGLIAATATDVLAFARMHLSGGLAADSTRVLATDSADAMQAEEVTLPDPYALADSWGLGWFRQDWNGTTVIGHDGNTIGQAAFLRIVPGRDLAVTMLTNGGHTRDLYQTLVREVVRELTGLEMPRPLAPPDEPPPVDIAPHAGTYERTGVRIEVWADETGPRMRAQLTQEVAGIPQDPTEFALVPVRDGLFVTREPGAETWTPVTFYALPDGTPYLHFGVRATPKVA